MSHAPQKYQSQLNPRHIYKGQISSPLVYNGAICSTQLSGGSVVSNRWITSEKNTSGGLVEKGLTNKLVVVSSK